MELALLVLASLLCALQAVRAPRLLGSALWLAGVSLLISVLLFLLGAPEIAVIELSVGAGLVTVLFVFAITISGTTTQDLPSIIPKPLAWGLLLAVVGLLGWFAWPPDEVAQMVSEPSFSEMLWQQRALDIWVQIAIIFAGVLGILGILAVGPSPVPKRPEINSQESGA